MDGKQIIFIGGLHRSGTSLLHEILRSHPAISGFAHTGVSQDEGQHLQTVYPAAKVFGGPGRFAFDDRSFMDETHPLATSENAKGLFAEWSRHWDLSKSRLIEKSPPNIVRARFLQALFPECRIVIILRHPIAVAYATRRWRKATIATLLDHTLRCYERFRADRPHLRRLHVLRYEEFVLDPQAHVRALLEWIGLEPFAFKNKVRPDVNGKYFARWRADRHSAWSRWIGLHRGLSAKWDAFEVRCRVFGYSLQSPEQLGPLDWTG